MFKHLLQQMNLCQDNIKPLTSYFNKSLSEEVVMITLDKIFFHFPSKKLVVMFMITSNNFLGNNHFPTEFP